MIPTIRSRALIEIVRHAAERSRTHFSSLPGFLRASAEGCQIVTAPSFAQFEGRFGVSRPHLLWRCEREGALSEAKVVFLAP
jgi:hypothetical protein